jgi:hypothetical protein
MAGYEFVEEAGGVVAVGGVVCSGVVDGFFRSEHDIFPCPFLKRDFLRATIDAGEGGGEE